MQETFFKPGIDVAIGRLIASERDTAGLAQAKAAEGFGVHRAVFAKMEAGGQEIFLEQLIELTNVLNTDLARFLPEISSVGTDDLRSILDKGLMPRQRKLMKALTDYSSKNGRSYLASREPKSKKARGK